MAKMELLRAAPLFVLLIACLNQQVLAEEMIQKSTSHGTSFSLEELMLLADATEKAQKSGVNDDDPAKVSNFQHRLKQIVQTARVAAGSGQSTGSDVLDQTIRQVRARINASGGGGSISDTSIFDAAIKTITNNPGGGANKPPTDSSTLIDTIVSQLSPEASTTPAPVDDSFLGGVLRQLANNNNDDQSSGTGKAILDAVVKQLVSTTTTTTTTTTTPKPQVLQILDGLIRTYQGSKTPQQVDGRSAAGSDAPASPPSGMPDPAKLLDGFKNILSQIQSKQGGGEGGNADVAAGQGSTGPQILEGFINQLKRLQNRGGTPSSPDAEASPSGGSTPDLAFLQNILKQFQSRLAPGGGQGTSSGPASPAASGTPATLEGFEGIIPEGGKAADVGPATEQAPVAPPTTGSPKPPSNNVPGQLLGGFLRQLSDNAEKSGNPTVGNFLKGLGERFRGNGK